MKYKLLKESALRALMEDDYDMQAEVEDMRIKDPDEFRKEVEAKYGPGYEGWLGGGWYKDGLLYQNPPYGTLRKMCPDGETAEVWVDGFPEIWTKEDMEDFDWDKEMPQRFPNRKRDHDAEDAEDMLYGPLGKSRRHVKDKDMRKMWLDRTIEKWHKKDDEEESMWKEHDLKRHKPQE